MRPYLEFNRQLKGDPLLKLGVAAIVELKFFLEIMFKIRRTDKLDLSEKLKLVK